MTNTRPAPAGVLAFIPPTFFGAVMGISGLGLAWRQAEKLLGWPPLAGDIVLVIGAAVLLVVLPAYAAKCLRHPAMMELDFAHPVKGPFLAGAPLAILLQVPALAPLAPEVANALFLFGAAFSLAITLYIFSRWFLRPQEFAQMNPIWLVPGVGSFLTALIGAPMGHTELCWFFFSIGVVIWIFLSAVLMYRIMFGPAFPASLVPSYFVPIVPPGLMSMIFPLLAPGPVAPFTKVVYFFALFLTLFNVAMFRIFLRVKFSIGWWAYTFPLDTITAATLIYADSTGNAYLTMLGQALLAVTTAVVALVFVRTLIDIAGGRVMVPDTPVARAPATA